MITYCPPQRHLVDSRSEEGNSGCRKVNNNILEKVVLSMDLQNLIRTKAI